MLILSAGELQIRPNGFVRTGLHGRLLEGDGKNPVSTVWMDSKSVRTGGGWCILFRISALEMLILSADELQIRPNGAYKIKGYPTFIVNQAVMQSAT